MFKKFNESFNLDDLKQQLDEAKNNPSNGERAEVPPGKYLCKIDKIELTKTGEKSKNPGTPMCSIQFRIVDGEYENQCLFYNKVLIAYVEDKETGSKKVSAMPLHFNNQFLKSLKIFTEEDIVFEDFNQYDDLLLDLAEASNKYGLQFEIQYSINKGFSNYEVKAVHENF